MIHTLYPVFQHWAETGSVYIISDTHFKDPNCTLMDLKWPDPESQLEKINHTVHKNDTLIHLGDVGNPEYISRIKAGYKVLIQGNHDNRRLCCNYFDEIYTGPLFIADRILLSHEPVAGLSWCFNIHGHDHNDTYIDNGHLNLAANVCGYTPVSLGKLIKEGILSGIKDIHRMTIDNASDRKREVRIDIDKSNVSEALRKIDKAILSNM